MKLISIDWILSAFVICCVFNVLQDSITEIGKESLNKYCMSERSKQHFQSDHGKCSRNLVKHELETIMEIRD